jgi:hypothetical protein
MIENAIEPLGHAADIAQDEAWLRNASPLCGSDIPLITPSH